MSTVEHSSETPNYDELVREHGDPQPVLDALSGDLDQPPPCIEEAHPSSDTAPDEDDVDDSDARGSDHAE